MATEHYICDVCRFEFKNPSPYSVSLSAELYEATRQSDYRLVYIEDSNGGYYKECNLNMCYHCYNKLLAGFTLRGEIYDKYKVYYYIND